MTILPSGTVTFLFTDIEGSTRLWDQYPQAMKAALSTHDTLLREAIEANGGYVFKTLGDGFCAAFSSTPDALRAALAGQRALNAYDWEGAGVGEGAIRTRIAVHTGHAEEAGGDYFGPSVNRVARLLAAGHGGQVLISMSARQWLHEPLPPGTSLRDMGQRRLKDLVQPERVFQVITDDLPTEFPPLRSLDARPNNLPLQPTALIGREAELEAVHSLVRSSAARLITFTGPGGVGKTRLALQAAADMLDDYEHGVYFVELSTTSDPNLVISTVAQSLGVRETGGQQLLESLKAYLKEKQILLLLDNFEHVVTAAPLIADLLSVAPRLTVLVTSREVLNLRGEREFPVPPLALPDREHLPLFNEMLGYAAVRLFVASAQAVRASFALTDENAHAVVEICHRLDGLPLAIELAASQIRLLSPQMMLSRMGPGTDLLTRGTRDAPERQQTLRNVIDWSYNLLNDGEQVLLRRLSVFAGGCTVAAAEAICGARTLEIEPGINGRSDNVGYVPRPVHLADVLDGILSLMGKSLLRQVEAEDTDPGFRMLQTIREYAEDRLAESGEAEAVRRKHANYYLALAEQSEPNLQGPEQKVWLDRLEAAHDNFRAALTWSKDTDPETALRVGGALYQFWYVRGYLTEGRRWLEAMIKSDSALPAAMIAKARYGVISLAIDQSDFDHALALLDDNLAFYRESGDKIGIANALNTKGVLASYTGDYEEAKAAFSEGLRLRRELDLKHDIAGSLNNLAHIALLQDDYLPAQSLLEESLSLFRETGNKRSASIALNNLGHVARNLGDYETARSRFKESLAIKEELGDKVGMASSLSGLGEVARKEGNHLEARAFYVKSLELCSLTGDKQMAAACLTGLADIARQEARPSEAARLLGWVEEMLDATGATLNVISRTEYTKVIESTKAQLDAHSWEKAISEGRKLGLEQAIAYATRVNSDHAHV